MIQPPKKQRHNLFFALLVPLVVTAMALLAAEWILRMSFESGNFSMNGARKETRGIGAMPNDRQIYVPDNELGFRPLHDGKIHTEFGCKPNSYPADKSATQRQRLLFIGDSVTDWGKIVDALRSLYGEHEYEYWNAGVSAYNTEQELKYYLRYNRKIEPDHVVLTFHNNDFVTTPLAYFDENDRLVRYFLHKPAPFGVNYWLFKHSLLYRKSVDLLLGLLSSDSGEVFESVGLSLLELKNAVAADGSRLTVLLLPILAPRDSWKSYELQNHRWALAILDQLGIRYFDLSPALEQALAKGIDPSQRPGDNWHPSDEVSEVFAQYLLDKGLLP